MWKKSKNDKTGAARMWKKGRNGKREDVRRVLETAERLLYWQLRVIGGMACVLGLLVISLQVECFRKDILPLLEMGEAGFQNSYSAILVSIQTLVIFVSTLRIAVQWENLMHPGRQLSGIAVSVLPIWLAIIGHSLMLYAVNVLIAYACTVQVRKCMLLVEQIKDKTVTSK